MIPAFLNSCPCVILPPWAQAGFSNLTLMKKIQELWDATSENMLRTLWLSSCSDGSQLLCCELPHGTHMPRAGGKPVANSSEESRSSVQTSTRNWIPPALWVSLEADLPCLSLVMTAAALWENESQGTRVSYTQIPDPLKLYVLF